MHCTVEEIQQRMSSSEFAEWVAFFRQNPFGHYRWDYGFAIVACTIANSNRSEKQEPFKIEDFLLNFEGSSKPDTASLDQKIAAVFGRPPKQ